MQLRLTVEIKRSNNIITRTLKQMQRIRCLRTDLWLEIRCQHASLSPSAGNLEGDLLQSS